MKLKCPFELEKPNPYLYTFKGTLSIAENKQLIIDSSNIILRGCSLRNTDWIIGLTIYTGHESKIMLNSVKARPKKSRVEI